MAFRIRADESVAEGLNRLAKKTLQAAHDELSGQSPPPDQSIHEARKNLKKARAILQTIQAADGGLNLDEERLRKVSHILSPLRDADAMRQILAKLRDQNPRLFSARTFARLSRQLASHRRELLESATRDDAWDKACRRLGRLQLAAEKWKPSHPQFGALAPGIRISHRNGRQAMARALKRQGAADFHEWRKAIKGLWYQLRLAEPCGPVVSRDVAALRRAETWLGDDHNLTVLCDELSEHAVRCEATVDIDRVRLAADRYGSGLRKKATTAMRTLYERKSGAYVREIKQFWQAQRSRP